MYFLHTGILMVWLLQSGLCEILAATFIYTYTLLYIVHFYSDLRQIHSDHDFWSRSN